MIKQIIDNYLLSKQEVSLNKFRISDAGKCKLMRYYKRQGIKATNEPDLKTRRTFEIGHMFHRWIQNLLKEQGYLVQCEFRVEDEHRVGHIDAIVKTPSGKLILYDFKTINSQKFSFIRSEVNKFHLQQIITYYMLLPFKKQIEDLRLVYISKDDLAIEEISVFREIDFDKLYKATEMDWNELIKAWEKGILPEPSQNEWECKHCIYYDLCINFFKR